MRPRTVVAIVGLVILLGTVVVIGFGGSSAGGDLTVSWISDTARNNNVNHHPIGVGPDGDVIVAPLSAMPSSGVQLTNTSCALVRLAPSNGSILWRNGVPPGACFLHALTQPAIGDVDEDGALEVVASTAQDALIALDARTGREEWRVPLTTYGYARPTIADITPATGREVVASDISGGILVTYGNGSAVWRFNMTKRLEDPLVYDAPRVADFDADGRVEILVGSSSGLLLLTSNGKVEWLRHSSSV